MKQHITEKQWDELDDKQKEMFKSKFKMITEVYTEYGRLVEVSIGAIIEFLGDDLSSILSIDRGMIVELFGKMKHNKMVKDFESKELCDALWEAVKYKLKQCN